MMKNVPLSSWLYPEEQAKVVRQLIAFDLIRSKDEPNFPLVRDGSADVYLDIHNARDNPRAIRFLVDVLSIPLYRLRSLCISEVSSTLSEVLERISMVSNISYNVFRDCSQDNQLLGSSVIKGATINEEVDFISDCITDGIAEVALCRRVMQLGIIPRSIIALVDCGQGWRHLFRDQGIDIPVWSGITMHDIRRELFCTGYMSRCEQHVEKDNRVIVAIDGGTLGE